MDRLLYLEKKMKILLLLTAFLNQQLTWYELYERGEKHFTKNEYDLCIEDMLAVIRIKPTPRKNQFTRAVQKVDYKPYYYLALAYFEKDELFEAFRYAQHAFEGEVVSESPALQSHLARILDDYRQIVQDYHHRYTEEEAVFAERAKLLAMLSEGRTGEVIQRLNGLDHPEKYEDIRLNLDLREANREQLAAFKTDLVRRIQTWINQGNLANATFLFENFGDNLEVEVARAITDDLEQLRKELEQEESAAPDATSQNEPESATAEKTEPENEQQSVDPQLIESYRTTLEEFQERNRSLDGQLGVMRRENTKLRSELDSRVEPAPSFEPKLFLSLIPRGKAVRIEGRAVSLMDIAEWQLQVNGSRLSLPSGLLVKNGSEFRLDHLLMVGDYGEHVVKLAVTDELGQRVNIEERIFLPIPWYLKRLFWMGFIAVLLVILFEWALIRHFRRRRARLRHFNPYIAGSPVRGAGMFYGRDELVQRIQGLVHKNSFMIHGNRRIGKTSLLLQLSRNLAELESEEYKFFPAFIDLQGVGEDDLFHHMMAEVLVQAEHWDIPLGELRYSDQNRHYLGRHFSSDIKKIIQELSARHKQHIMVVLLMDEVDVLNEFGEKTNQKLRGIFMKDFAEHLSCVMAGIHLKKEWESAGSPWYNFFEEIPIHAFDEKAARKLVLNPVKGIFRYRGDAVDLIIKETGGHPYLIQKLCVSVIGEKLRSNRFTISRTDIVQALKQMNEESGRNRL